MVTEIALPSFPDGWTLSGTGADAGGGVGEIDDPGDGGGSWSTNSIKYTLPTGGNPHWDIGAAYRMTLDINWLSGDDFRIALQEWETSGAGNLGDAVALRDDHGAVAGWQPHLWEFAQRDLTIEFRFILAIGSPNSAVRCQYRNPRLYFLDPVGAAGNRVEDLLTAEEAAASAGVSVDRIAYWNMRGHLWPQQGLGIRILYSQADVDKAAANDIPGGPA